MLVGLATVVVDFLIYRLLLIFLALSLAKALGFLIGSVFSYHSNRLWTFQAGGGGIIQACSFGMLYFVTLLLNVAVNTLMLALLPSALIYRLGIAFLLATGVSASLNFIGMKFFVFSRANQRQ